MATRYAVYRLDRLIRPFYVVTHHENLGCFAVEGLERASVLYEDGFADKAESEKVAESLNAVREVLES